MKRFPFDTTTQKLSYQKPANGWRGFVEFFNTITFEVSFARNFFLSRSVSRRYTLFLFSSLSFVQRVHILFIIAGMPCGFFHEPCMAAKKLCTKVALSKSVLDARIRVAPATRIDKSACTKITTIYRVWHYPHFDTIPVSRARLSLDSRKPIHRHAPN